MNLVEKVTLRKVSTMFFQTHSDWFPRPIRWGTEQEMLADAESSLRLAEYVGGLMELDMDEERDITVHNGKHEVRYMNVSLNYAESELIGRLGYTFIRADAPACPSEAIAADCAKWGNE